MLGILLPAINAGAQERPKSKPNIVIILANDLGIGTLGVYGQAKIETPNIDALAAEGMRFKNFYSGSPSDAPSLGIWLTGKHAGNAAIRGTDEWLERGPTTNYVKVLADSSLEGQRPLPVGEETIADILKMNGYTTGAFGIWGLGSAISEGSPLNHGFDTFYGYTCLRQAQTYYPKYLWSNSRKVNMDNALVFPNMKLAGNADPNKEENYMMYTLDNYAPDSIFIHTLRYIDSQSKQQPFFLLYASPLAKGPLQLSDKSLVRRYERKFLEEPPYLGNSGGYPCRTPRATYAAIVTYFDRQVGQIVDELKQKGLYDNTIIIFASDNGATLTNGIDASYFEAAGPYAVSNTRGKDYLFESGIRVPFFVVWPGMIDPKQVSEQQAISYDILPTITEVVGLERPSYTDGISILPTLLGKEQDEQHDYLYWENSDNTAHQAVKMGKWKLIGRNMSFVEPDYELYDMSEDPTETKNVAADNPAVVDQLKALMQRARKKPMYSSFYLNSLDVPQPPAVEPQKKK